MRDLKSSYKSLRPKSSHSLLSKAALQEIIVLLTDRENHIPVWHQLTANNNIYLPNEF